MTGLDEKARQAARSVFLTVAARVLSVITPIVFAPLLYWAAETIDNTQKALIDVMARVIVLERAEARRESDSRLITNRRDDQINEIVQRLARVETQMTATVDALNRLTDRLDRRGETEQPRKRADAQP